MILLQVERTTLIVRDVVGASADEVRALFTAQADFPKIVAVRPDVNNTYFVQFQNEDDLLRAVTMARSIQYKGQPLKFGIKSENIRRGFFSLPAVPPQLQQPATAAGGLPQPAAQHSPQMNPAAPVQQAQWAAYYPNMYVQAWSPSQRGYNVGTGAIPAQMLPPAATAAQWEAAQKQQAASHIQSDGQSQQQQQQRKQRQPQQQQQSNKPRGCMPVSVRTEMSSVVLKLCCVVFCVTASPASSANPTAAAAAQAPQQQPAQKRSKAAKKQPQPQQQQQPSAVPAATTTAASSAATSTSSSTAASTAASAAASSTAATASIASSSTHSDKFCLFVCLQFLLLCWLFIRFLFMSVLAESLAVTSDNFPALPTAAGKRTTPVPQQFGYGNRAHIHYSRAEMAAIVRSFVQQGPISRPQDMPLADAQRDITAIFRTEPLPTCALDTDVPMYESLVLTT